MKVRSLYVKMPINGDWRRVNKRLGLDLGIRDICMKFGRSLTGYSLVISRSNITKLGN